MILNEFFTKCFLKHLIEVRKNGGEPILAGEEGKYTTQFALAALKSSTEGKEINPGDIRD